MTTDIVIPVLASLETKAERHLETWKHAYWKFWTVLLEIRDTGVWEQAGQDTWESYLESRWIPSLQVGYSRIRQIQAAYPIMQTIKDVTGVTLNENQIRTVKTIVPQDEAHLLPEVVSIAYQHTSAPSPRHFKAAYETVSEREKSNTVSVDGETRSLNITTIAAKEAMLEADKRYNEYKTQGLQDVPVSVMRIGDKAYAVLQLPNDYPIGLLENYIAKVPKDDKVRKPAMDKAS